MKFGIIGAGSVGKALGERLKAAGHTVHWGVRDPEGAAYTALGATTVPSAVSDADIVILAVPWAAARAAITTAGDLTGKILIDATNPIAPDFAGLVGLDGSSAAELIASWPHGAHVVKAFNTIGSNIMEDPTFGGGAPALLIASDYPDAKARVMAIAGQLGFDPIDAGPLNMARYLEHFAWVWIALAAKQGLGREIAFRLMKR